MVGGLSPVRRPRQHKPGRLGSHNQHALAPTSQRTREVGRCAGQNWDSNGMAIGGRDGVNGWRDGWSLHVPVAAVVVLLVDFGRVEFGSWASIHHGRLLLLRYSRYGRTTTDQKDTPLPPT